MISYFEKVSSTAKDLTWDVLQRLLDSPEVSMTMDAIRAESDHDRRGELKRRLPAVTWQSHFSPGSRRSDKNAHPTGFFMLDIDHLSNPMGLWDISRKQLALKDVLIAHITPSGKGLRIVMKGFPGLTKIPDNQEHLAKILKLNEYDAACKDFARLSYLCRRADVLYLNKDLFESNFEKTIINEKLIENQNSANSSHHPMLFGDSGESQVADTTGNSSADAVVLQDGADKQLMYHGTIPYKTIIKELVSTMGGAPQEGSRNTFLYRLARQLRYIVDFNPLQLVKILPTFGLPASEVENVAQSACKSVRSEKIPYALYMILQRLENPEDEEDDADDEADITDSAVSLPPLPPVFKQFVRIAPDDFKIPTIIALLPVMGTLMSRLRANYIDGEKHALNFAVVVEGPQASGKSFTRRIVDICMEEVKYMDDAARLAEQHYSKLLKKARNSKQQPEEPTAVVRTIPASISIGKLLKRLAHARGLHLFTFLEELDTMTKTNKSGMWSLKTDIYRNAFDNSDYGQDYLTDISFSGDYPVYYNMLVCGTPNAVGRFYNDPEDGLVSRVVFCILPSQFGKKIPIPKRLTSKEKKIIDDCCARCNDELCCTPEHEIVPEHMMNMKFLCDALYEWIEKQRLLSIKEVSLSRNIFHRRAAVMGFRAGMMAHYLYGEKNSGAAHKKVIKFAIFVAEYVLESQLEKFGAQLEKTYMKKKKEVHVNLYSVLPEEFCRNDIINMIAKYNISTPVKNIVYGWKSNGYIEETAHYRYKKI